MTPKTFDQPGASRDDASAARDPAKTKHAGDPQRWRQRLENLNKALLRLNAACAKETYSDLELAGLVQTYEFTFELCWKTLKDKLTFDGYEVNSPREAIKQAFAAGFIADAEPWLEALDARNLFSHTYDDAIAHEAEQLIKNDYAPMLRVCVAKLNTLAGTP